ncbi:hypothetical protein BOX15_Mlig022653g1 [Macrostomum lignano]|uniref:TNase-like domain-containing protein n=1 Tax=Macrostomum lignano TaxID=282301 RepID=A0A267F1P1_9PLAT|nr:hypothetical protein BOX15_Mlig022653g1 [Macrostomum lignano]
MQIDAPELSQAHGRDSRKALASRLPRGTRVCVISPGRDYYHRILGFVCLAKDDIAYRMLAEGHAWCYHNTCNLRYKAATSAARVAGLGPVDARTDANGSVGLSSVSAETRQKAPTARKERMRGKSWNATVAFGMMPLIYSFNNTTIKTIRVIGAIVCPNEFPFTNT